MKPEIRMPNAERNPKPEGRTAGPDYGLRTTGLRDYGPRTTDHGTPDNKTTRRVGLQPPFNFQHFNFQHFSFSAFQFFGPRPHSDLRTPTSVLRPPTSVLRPPTSVLRPPSSVLRSRAFTLLEFIGVLAVIAILAAALVPVVIKRVDIAAVNTETANLNNLSHALVLQALHNYQIPDQTTWAAAVGNWLSLPAASITNNARNYNRAFLYDAGGFYP